MPTETEPRTEREQAIATMDAAAFDLHGAHAPTESWMLCQDRLCLRRRDALRVLRAALALAQVPAQEAAPPGYAEFKRSELQRAHGLVPSQEERPLVRRSPSGEAAWHEGYAFGLKMSALPLPDGHPQDSESRFHRYAPSVPAQEERLNVERLGFDDLLRIGEALLEHYPPDTIVCSHSVKADIGARTAAGIADLIESCRALGVEPAKEDGS